MIGQDCDVRVRSSYPRPLLDRVVTTSAVEAGDRLLEIGCGRRHWAAVLHVARRRG